MSQGLVYGVDEANVINDTIDGEVVIVNLTEGTYYTLQGVGAEVWHWLQKHPCDLDFVVSELCRSFALGAEQIGPGLESFWEELIREGLLCARVAPSAPPSWTLVPGPYQQPKLQKYTDLQDMLLFDPIHNVDEKQGWPVLSQDAPRH